MPILCWVSRKYNQKFEVFGTVESEVTTGRLTVGFEGDQTSTEVIAERVEKAGCSVENDDKITATFTVPEMDCPSCAGKIENALKKVEGVSS